MTRFNAVFLLAGGAALGLVVCAPPARAESVIVSPETAVVSPDEMSRAVKVEDVRVRGDEVSAKIVNNSGKAVRDVQLLVKYVWLWNNERKPGTDNPGRSAYETLPGELAPGESKEFTYRPDQPLPHRTDGHFDPSVEVAGVTEITVSQGPLGMR